MIGKVSPQSNVAEASIEMTKYDLGVVSVVDQDGVLMGVFTDGDLRRNSHLKIFPMSKWKN